jgi:cobaltochelatase CobT
MKINPRVVIVREAIAKIVEMLAFRKLKVTQEGVKAYVLYNPKSGEPERLNLPYLPDDAPDSLIDATQGFLDHECGHLLFSEFGPLKRSVAKGKSFAFLVNLLEDTFIERKMAERFRGSSANLGSVMQFVLDSVTLKRLREIEPGDTGAMLGVLIVPAVRAWAGQHICKDFMKPYWTHIQEFVDRMGPDIESLIQGINSSEDSFRVAEEIVKRAAPPEGEGGSGEAREGEGGGEGGSGEKRRGEACEGEEVEDKGGTEGEGEDGGEGEGEEGSAAVTAKKVDPDPKIEKEKKFKKRGKGKTKAPKMKHGSVSATITVKDEEEKEDPITEAITGLEEDFDDMASEAISAGAAEAAKDADYLVWSTDHDVVEAIPVPADFADNTTCTNALKRMVDKVDHLIGPMQKDVERAVAARSASIMVPGFSSGKLHGAALTRLQFHRDDVFRRKTENRTKDVVVGLVVDASGSMSGQIETAAYAAYALSAVLDRLNIANEVTAFTTTSYRESIGTRMKDDIEALKKAGCERYHYSRTEPLYTVVVKELHERINPKVKERFVTLANFFRRGLRNNVDGESVEYAHRRIMKHRAARKVLIVLSDGAPCADGDYSEQDAHLKAVVKLIQKSGTDVVGIGIESNAVASYYAKHVVLNDISALPGTVMSQLKQLLIPRV